MTRPLITAAELRAGTADPVVLDATVDLPRPAHDGDHRAGSGLTGWADAHLPGSRHLDLLAALADPDAGYHFAHPGPGRAHRVLHGLGVRDGRPVVVYDRADGFWAARAWWTLRALGVTARVLDGGLSAWRAAGGPVVAGGAETGAEAGTAGGAAAGTDPGRAPVPGTASDPGVLTLRPRPELWADLAEVRAIVDGHRPGRLVCALGAEQFDGTAPTRYSRRGHIPGSVNLPARSVTAADGTLLAPDLLRAAAATLHPVPATGRTAPTPAAAGPLVLYCGGGIAASHLALALVVAGERDVRIYDGSLEEWSARADLPLSVTGPTVPGPTG
ncbi:MAG TPA: rhodanese-like domain-containing protein [Cellulomonas sp.]